MDPLLYEMYESLPRQGPGSFEATEKAFSFIKDKLPYNPTILDIGCGTGAATFALAKLNKATIYALDNYPKFLEKIKQNPKFKSFTIKPVLGDMTNLKFPEAQLFDVIWSEGAAYIYGFENALINWKKFLKPNGFMVISDCAWRKKGPYPIELEKFWKEEYPTMPYIDEFYPKIGANGYTLISSFNLPKELFWTNYYDPQEKYIKNYIDSHKGDTKIANIFAGCINEIGIFKKYADYYGYSFFIMQKS